MSPIRRAIGEGALAGWAIGGLLAGWDIYLSQDVGHGMFRVAAGRWLPLALVGTLSGAVLSGLVDILLSRLARAGRRWLSVGSIALALCYGTALVLAAGPLRPRLFPLRIFSGKPLSIAMFAALAGVLGILLLARVRGRWSEEAPAQGGGARTAPRIATPAWVGIVLGLLTVGCGAALAWIAPERSPGNLPVILVCLDTLRADRLGVLGNPRPLTPRLDALAREGVVFEQADAAAPWTLPSVASLFTSMLPYDHRARWEHRPLRPGVATLAEHFREAGYRTASFNGGGYVSAYLGLAQGFQIYEEHDEGRAGGLDDIAAAALSWVRGVGDTPYFLFVHTYEVHTPYTHDAMADPADAGRLGRSFEIKDVVAVQKGEMVLTAGERRYVSGLYDSDVAHADQVIGGLLETLQRDGILDRALLIVLADHGEDLWDHNEVRSPGHGHSLYEVLLRVPLFLRAPGLIPPGTRIRTPISLLDVAPTLLSLTGLPPDPEHQGRSLASSILEGVEPSVAPIHAESIEYGPDRFSLRDGNLKVVLTPLPDQVNAGVGFPVRPLEIFDLELDPQERDPLPASPPPGAAEAVERLRERIERVFEPLRNMRDHGELPERLREQLRSLGYID